MKRFKNFLLAFVLMLAFCLPVFGLVGCDTNKSEMGIDTAAFDVVKAGNGCLSSLVKQHTALVEKYELYGEEHPVDWENNDQAVYQRLSEMIPNFWNDGPLSNIMNYVPIFVVAEPGELYIADGWLKAEKTDYGFSGTEVSFDSENKHLNEMKIMYEGNKLSRIEMTGTSYHYLADWEKFGIQWYSKEIFDFKTNLYYCFEASAVVPEKKVEEDPGEVGGEAYEMVSDEYWNGLEIFLDAYNSGKVTMSLLNQIFNGSILDGYDWWFERLDTMTDDDPDFSDFLRMTNKAGVDFEYAKLDDIPEYGIFDGEELPEISEDVLNELHGTADIYVMRDNGIFINKKELALNYNQTLKALKQIVKIAHDYKDWIDNMPTMPEAWHEETECEWDETYPAFPYNVALNTDEIEDLDRMLTDLENTKAKDWQNRLLVDVWTNERSIEHDDQTNYDYIYADACPDLTEIDAEGNHTYYFEGYEGATDWHLTFTQNPAGKVTGFEFWNHTEVF